jgi:hypothetical protein
MIEPDWTPDEAHRLLRDALERCMYGELTPTHLQTWLTTTYATPPETPERHPAIALWKQAVVNVAVYLQCDFDRPVLLESLNTLLAADRAGNSAILTPITRSPCFFAMFKDGTVPSPLIALDTEERYRRYRLMREGFTDT